MRNLNDKIPGAPNFRYGEFVKSSTAIRHGINNIPTNEKVWLSLERLAVNVLQPIRNEFGRIRIESGYRCPKLNVKIGGSTTSNHCRGEAADIKPVEEGVTLIDVLCWTDENLKYRELIAEYFTTDNSGGWIHVAYRQDNNINKLKLKDANHNFKQVSIDYIKSIYA